MKLQIRNLKNTALGKKLHRQPWVAGITGGGVFAVLAGFAFFLPQLYSASATLVVTNPGIFSLEAANREALSNANLEKLIKRFGMNDEYASDSVKETIEHVRQAISVDFSDGGETTRKSFVISFHGADPRKTIDVTNTLASFYIGRNSTAHNPSAPESSQVSQASSEEHEQILRQIEEQKRQILQYKNRYQKELPEQLEVNKKTVASLHGQISVLTDDLKRKRHQRAALTHRVTFDGEVKPKNADANLPMLISYASSLRQELAELRNLYADTHPKVQRVRQELESLEARIKLRSKQANRSNRGKQQGKGRILVSVEELDAEISQLEKERKKLEQQLKEYQRYINNTPKREQELHALILANQALEERYASDFDHAPAVKIEERRTVQILHPATSATVPLGFQRLSFFLGALVLGIGAAFTSVFIWEKFIDTSFHAETELETETHFPVLVTIPRITSDRGERTAGI